jgi:hypothetical protein
MAFDQTGFVLVLVSLACGHPPDFVIVVLAQKEAEVVTALQHLHWAALGCAKAREPEVVVVVQVVPQALQLDCARRSLEALGSSPLCTFCKS